MKATIVPLIAGCFLASASAALAQCPSGYDTVTVGTVVIRTCVDDDDGTFTVELPRRGLPAASSGVTYPAGPSDYITVPNRRPIYAILVSGFAANGNLDQLLFYNFAHSLMSRNAYVHWSWWNNLLASHMAWPLHDHTLGGSEVAGSHPGYIQNILNTPDCGVYDAQKGYPSEDYQFQADALRYLAAIRHHNPSAQIILAGHSMGGASVARLATKAAGAGIVIDLVAPIDPVGNRSQPAESQPSQGYCYTRWRAAHLWDYEDGPITPFAGQAARREFGTNVINLYHRWQSEFLPPADYVFQERFDHDRTLPLPANTHSSQEVITNCCCGPDARFPTISGYLKPACSGQDGHGEIVGYFGAIPVWPIGIAPQGNWFGIASRRANLESLERHAQEGLAWPLGPAFGNNPDYPGGPWPDGYPAGRLCRVSAGLSLVARDMNRPPVANAGPGRCIEIAGSETAITLDASASSDVDPGDLSDPARAYKWTTPFGDTTGLSPTMTLPLGDHPVTLTVTDRVGHIAKTTIRVNVLPFALREFERSADAYMSAAARSKGYSFDRFYPGLSGAVGCLSNPPGAPVTLALDGGTVTLKRYESSGLGCAIVDGSSGPRVADASTGGTARLVLAFEPPVTAFYTYFGSLPVGMVATMKLFSGGARVATLDSPPGVDLTLAIGHGFVSEAPIDSVEITSTDALVQVGAFVGLAAGEPSLGTEFVPEYSANVPLDFACAFAPSLALVEFEGADLWLPASGPSEGYSFDRFYPGLSGATGCLTPPGQPVTLALEHGAVTVKRIEGSGLGCAIIDGSTGPRVADGSTGGTARFSMAFEPAVTAFYTYYGSLAPGHTADLKLHAGGEWVATLTSLRGVHATLAIGHGFVSQTPVDSVEIISTDPAVQIGAFVGLASGVTSLGTDFVPDYGTTVERDFACTFASQVVDVGTHRDPPLAFRLGANVPNPFSGMTVIRFELPRPARVDLHLYDVRGRHVRRLASGARVAGRHEQVWDGRNQAGLRVAPGVYFCKMSAEHYQAVRRLVLLP